MEDYQFTSSDSQDSENFTDEQIRVMSELANGGYPLTHCYFVFYSEDKPKGYWGVTRLPELLALYKKGIETETNKLFIATLWSDQPGLVPDTTEFVVENSDELPSGTLRVIAQGTPMSMSDFIYACCLSHDVLYDNIVPITAILLTPTNDTHDAQCERIFRSLVAINKKLNESTRSH